MQCQLSVPRSVVERRDAQLSLHGFSDASKRALCAAIYVVTHILLENGGIQDISSIGIAIKESRLPCSLKYSRKNDEASIGKPNTEKRT